ncbi:NYN domain-containing protein [Crocosphaera sp. UHCC 0190]|uniref:NYN domain-containing protein n=1 Tax=Crocosphaera sp. UHCC 0190 TaxID=3110246 RepID=UPI002B1E9E1F|nr:NYN domain-containing protein [Crocosphaera sp. UHCC 0190]MEA5510907.1 NYN domain-containing protein [Crocosphaera sp. UHCC 0190]
MKSLENGSSNIRLAVLIDAENVSASVIEPLMQEIAKYGTANVKRIYGDWTSNQLNSWKSKLNKLAIQPMQQFRYTAGKNATDSALIIDAMDLLYTGNFDGFCLVSSDSDFTRLASRIRESGLIVYGFGERQKTPEAFVVACNKFIYTDILDNKKASKNQDLTSNKQLLELLKSAYESVADEEGWAHLGPFGSQLTKLSPSFDSRNYGYKKLSELVQSVDIFEIKKTRFHLTIKLQ